MRGHTFVDVFNPAIERVIRKAAFRPRIADLQRAGENRGAFFLRLFAGGLDPRDEKLNRVFGRQERGVFIAGFLFRAVLTFADFLQLRRGVAGRGEAQGNPQTSERRAGEKRR